MGNGMILAMGIAMAIAIGLIVLRFFTFWRLEALNNGNVRKAQETPVPEEAKTIMGEEAYRRSLAYTLEKSRLSLIEQAITQVVLIAVLLSGVAEIWFGVIAEPFLGGGAAVWGQSLYLFSFFLLYGWVGIPFSLYRTFNLEVRYGFNTMTWGLYVRDFLKSLLLSAVIMVPLLAGVFALYGGLGQFWWIYAAGLMIGFQFLMQILFPRFILPLFNKLEPLGEGELRNEIFALAKETAFETKNIFVMDGSKRSRHSNAFFTGLGRSRRVVLFDTLVEQLSISELKAVLAHEVGHYKRKHIAKGLIFSVITTFVSFYFLHLFATLPIFNESFGLRAGEIAQTLLLVSLLSGTITFYFKPLGNIFSRKNEYEADAYAKTFTSGDSLIGALKKLYKENLTNLNPHPVYSFFYYSHPTLAEREAKLLGKPGQ